MATRGKGTSAVFTGQEALMGREDTLCHGIKPFFMKSKRNLFSFPASRCGGERKKKKLHVFTLSLGLYWMTYSIWPFGPSSMSIAPLFPENPVKMVVPTGVNCKNRQTDRHALTPESSQETKNSLQSCLCFFPLLHSSGL